MALRPLHSALALLLLFAAQASAQARVETIILGADASPVLFVPLGSMVEKELKPDMNLLPGDLVYTSAEGTTLVLRCPPEGGNTFAVESPFRVQVSVPREASCRFDVGAGSMDVLAEEPTEVTSGGVNAGSVTTQYAVRAIASEAGVSQEVNVFDGEVFVLTEGGSVGVRQGSSLTYEPELGETFVGANSDEDIRRSAAVYSAFDLDQAIRAGAEIGDPGELLVQLQGLHYEVLSEPDDEARRVELARVQLQYQATDQALYNLKRADVTTEDRLQQYNIDPSVFQSGFAPGSEITPTNQRFLQDRNLIDAESILRGIESYEPKFRTIDMDMKLIDASRLSEALEGLQYRSSAGQATSRDYFALSKIYLEQGDAQASARYGDRALAMFRRDRGLSKIEFGQLRRILARARAAPPP